MNILIVEDNKDIRNFLKVILSKVSYVKTIHEASNFAEAYQKVMRSNYNVVFLDVDLGEDVNGIQLGKELRKISPEIQIIFSTAYREFAFEAFELEAVDYLLKPFNESKVIHAIGKVKKSLHNTKEVTIQVDNYFINVNNIIFIEKLQSKRKLQFVTKQEIIDTYDTLSNIEKRLPRFFIRTHRSFLVNVHEIKQIVSDNAWSHVIKFHSTDRTAILSREKHKELSKLISTS